MTQITEEQIAEIEGLLARSCDRPWRRNKFASTAIETEDGRGIATTGGYSTNRNVEKVADENQAHADLILALANAAPALISAARLGIAAGAADAGESTNVESFTLRQFDHRAREYGIPSVLPHEVVERHRRTAEDHANLWTNGSPAARQSIFAALLRVEFEHARSSLSQPPAPAEGWRIVPVEPTDEMIAAAHKAVVRFIRKEARTAAEREARFGGIKPNGSRLTQCEKHRARYKAMIKAAPLPAAPEARS